MIKKIVIGIIVAAVLSLGAAGFIYAYQKEQPKSNAAALAANNKNESAVTGTENKYQYGNAYGETKKNGNCEPENNRFSQQYGYNHKNENCGEDNHLEYNYRCQNPNAGDEKPLSHNQNPNRQRERL